MANKLNKVDYFYTTVSNTPGQAAKVLAYAQAVCREKAPVQEEIAPGHFVSCHRARELSLRGVDRSIAGGGLTAHR